MLHAKLEAAGLHTCCMLACTAFNGMHRLQQSASDSAAFLCLCMDDLTRCLGMQLHSGCVQTIAITVYWRFRTPLLSRSCHGDEVWPCNEDASVARRLRLYRSSRSQARLSYTGMFVADSELAILENPLVWHCSHLQTLLRASAQLQGIRTCTICCGVHSITGCISPGLRHPARPPAAGAQQPAQSPAAGAATTAATAAARFNGGNGAAAAADEGVQMSVHAMHTAQYSRNLPLALLTPVKSHADSSYPILCRMWRP